MFPFPQYQKEVLGTFEVVSGNLVVSDPCYEEDLDILKKAKKGTWEAIVVKKIEFGLYRVVSGIVAKHVDASDPIMLEETKPARFGVHVDSGQAGIFDAAHYQDDSVIESFDPRFSFENPWYNKCCELTCSLHAAGILPYGAVSSSGNGDGTYQCRYRRNESGEIDYVRIEFLK